MLKHVSLTYKMLVITLLVCAAAWGVLDHVQTKSIGALFQARMVEELAEMAQADRIAFDGFVKTHAQSVRLFVSMESFNDYLDRAEASGWDREQGPPVLYSRRPPPWYPRMSVARAFMQARYAFLLSPDGRVREIYQTGPVPPPDELMAPDILLRELSHNQSYMTSIDGSPYLIASEYVSAPDGRVRATLVLASPLDDETLFATHGMAEQSRVTVLMSGEDPVVIASSRPDLIPSGARLHDLSDGFLMAGKSFFDYGSSDLRLQFSSFITKDKMQELTGAVLRKERAQRAITAIVLVMSFAFIMFWITGNLMRLTGRVADFSRNVLGLTPAGPVKGDELAVLNEAFDSLTAEVITARERLEKDAQDMLLLERRAADAKLRERDISLLMQVMEILGVGVIGHGPDGPLAVNPVMERFATDCGGLGGFMLEDGTGSRELFIEDCKGESRYFSISRFYTTDTGKGYILVHDLTEARRAEVTLRESEGRARAITETATDAIILIDHEGRVTYWNPAAQKIFGYTREEVMGKDVHDILTPEKYLPAAREGFEQFTRTGTGPALGISRMLTAIRKDGSEFPVELSLSAFQQKGRWVAVGVVRDITQRVKAEEDRSAMFHMMTHDIKGPLSIIYGYSELLNAQLTEKENLDMVTEIQTAAGRISSLIDDMLALSRIEKGRASMSFEKLSLKTLIETAVLDCELTAREMDVSFEVKVDEGLPEITADKGQLGRAIGNLAANAVNYNRHGGRVVISAGRSAQGGGHPDDGVFVEVTDTGMGIPAEDIPHIFEKYFRSRSTSKRRGTGLGLAIVKAAVEAHGGSVSVRSRQGEGTTFRIELSVSPPSSASEKEGSQNA